MDGIGALLRKTRACGTGGSRGERKHPITPGDARAFANPTCGASARLVNLYSSYEYDFVLFCLVDVVSFLFVFFLRYTVGESGIGPAPVFILLSFLFFGS